MRHMVLAISILWWIFLVCLTMATGAWAVFWLSIRSGQFDDPEAVARNMLELDAREAPLPEPREEGERATDAARAPASAMGAERR